MLSCGRAYRTGSRVGRRIHFLQSCDDECAVDSLGTKQDAVAHIHIFSQGFLPKAKIDCHGRHAEILQRFMLKRDLLPIVVQFFDDANRHANDFTGVRSCAGILGNRGGRQRRTQNHRCQEDRCFHLLSFRARGEHGPRFSFCDHEILDEAVPGAP